MRTRKLPFTLLALALLAGCERAPQTESPEQRAAREAAARDACIAAELAARGRENFEMLQQLAGDGEQGAGIAGAARAAYEFARGYAQLAELRHHALAYVDSAMNHSRAAADSARFVAAAQDFAPPPPEPGTLEANVTEAWLRDYAAARADQDHRCNWEI